MTEFSETSLKALKIIKKHKKGISITELAKLLGVAKSNLGTRHLRPLKDAGLISENFKIDKDFCVKATGKKLKEIEKEEEIPKEVIPKEIPHHKIPRKPAEIKAELKELTKPERRAKIIKAKEGLVMKKHAKWIKKSQFQHLPIGWFQHRPAETKRYLRYMINILYSGSGRDKKIKSTYGNYANFRAIINTLIDFL